MKQLDPILTELVDNLATLSCQMLDYIQIEANWTNEGYIEGRNDYIESCNRVMRTINTYMEGHL